MKILSPPVLYYHSVAPAFFEVWVLKWLTLKLQAFEAQMAYLKANGFRAIFLDEWLDIRQGRKTSTGKEVCLTFDDGLLDNWVYAFPVAKKYGMKLTLFISPECIDQRETVRPTLEDVWNGHCKESDLDGLGYLSWNELKTMQESGYVDVQSHTMTHAKYIASPEIYSFYYGGFKGMHAILNAHPEMRSFYMKDPLFEERLKWGTPLFVESSAATARKHSINPEFLKEVNCVAEKLGLKDKSQRPAFEEKAMKIYGGYKAASHLVQAVEPEKDYQARLLYEIVDSKTIIEAKLKKPVQFLCWPHGDNTAAAHRIAREAGYLATTSGKMIGEASQPDRIPRFGADFNHPRWLSKLKLHYKIAGHYHREPFYSLWQANEFKNKMMQRGKV